MCKHTHTRSQQNPGPLGVRVEGEPLGLVQIPQTPPSPAYFSPAPLCILGQGGTWGLLGPSNTGAENSPPSCPAADSSAGAAFLPKLAVGLCQGSAHALPEGILPAWQAGTGGTGGGSSRPP